MYNIKGKEKSQNIGEKRTETLVRHSKTSFLM